MSVAVTGLHRFYRIVSFTGFISFNKNIFQITADNFINEIMVPLKEDTLLFQQQEKSFLSYFSVFQ